MAKDFSLISNKLNTYFKNRKICVGSSIPVSGDYVPGDIVIKENPVAGESIGWICITGGSPGEWTEILGGGNTDIEIPDKSITEVKLADDVVNKINKVNDIGNKNQLQTVSKNDLVSAINEVFQSANNGKDIIANAIGSPLVNSDTFSDMGSKIDTLTKTFQNNLSEKGIEVLPTDKIPSLINKVVGVNTGKKFAMGTCNPGDLIREYNGILYHWYIEERSLDFLPNTIIIIPNKVEIQSSISIYTDIVSIFGENGNDQWNMSIVPKNFNGTTYYNNGFKAFVYSAGSVTIGNFPVYTWFAFE